MHQTNRQATNKSVWWWAYFALSVVVLVASVVTSWHMPIRNLSLSVFYGVGLLGLCGYLRSAAIGHRLFWVAYVVLVIAGASYSAGTILLRAAHSDALFLISFLLLGLVFSAPTWVALWRYAFRSNSIWQSSSAAA